MTLPEGRTQKACTHAIDKLRKDAAAVKMGGELAAPKGKRKAAKDAEGVNGGNMAARAKRIKKDEMEAKDDDEMTADEATVKDEIEEEDA